MKDDDYRFWSQTAQDIMTTPAKFVYTDETIEKTKQSLTKYGINALIVLNKKKNLAGIITRQTIDKAISHEMGSAKVGDYIDEEPFYVTAETPLDSIKKIILDIDQRLLPVVEDKKVVGVITRTELLSMFYQYQMGRDHPNIPENQAIIPYKKNIKHLLEKRLPEKIKVILTKIGKVGDKLHFNVYVIGGFVRDLILDKENYDVDIVSEKNGILFAEYLADEMGGQLKTYNKFGTATVIFSENFKIDISTARTEHYVHPGALPTVEMSSIKQDLYRRDFTINALAIALNERTYGTLLDFFGGQRDINNGIIKVLHSFSFVEDPTRIFRAIRLEQRYGFNIGKHTLTLINNAVGMNFLDSLSGTRLLTELRLIFEESDPLSPIKRMAGLNVLRVIHPKIQLNDDTLGLLENIKNVFMQYKSMFQHKKYLVWLVYLLGIIDQLTIEEIDEVCKRLLLAKKYARILKEGWSSSRQVQEYLGKNSEVKKNDVLMLMHHLSSETILFIIAKTKIKIKLEL
ncbi:MAG: CBS domain-containing protein [bacterium]